MTQAEVSDPQSRIPHPRSPVATAMWLAPALLLFISAYLLRAGLEQRAVAAEGVVLQAVVDSVDLRQRSEITRGAAYLRYTPPGAPAPIVRPVELPLTYLQHLEERVGETIPIRIGAGSGQVVLADHARTQWILTLSFSVMALIGALGLVWMVGSWNRYLAREGDPAERELPIQRFRD